MCDTIKPYFAQTLLKQIRTPEKPGSNYKFGGVQLTKANSVSSQSPSSFSISP